MIAALIIAIVTGSLVGLFLKTVTQEIEYAHRSRMALMAVNVAEAGIEHALYAFNEEDWSGWNKGTYGYYKPTIWLRYSEQELKRKEARTARVYIQTEDDPPRAVAEGIVTKPNGMQVTRQIYVELGNRSLFANGILAKTSLGFNGNGIYVDSYLSSVDGGYKAWYTDDDGNYRENLNDNGSVASLSVEADAMNFGNADIWGTAATGGGSLAVGPNGTVRGEDTPAGVSIDTTRVSYDFYASVPDAELPTKYWSSAPSGYTITTGDYTLTDFIIKSGDIIVIEGEVELYVKDDVNISGVLLLAPDSTLKIYVADDFTVDGNAAAIANIQITDETYAKFLNEDGSRDYATLEDWVVNEMKADEDDTTYSLVGVPENLQVFSLGKDDPSTSTIETPEFKLAGRGSFAGSVYAPNADINLGGSGNKGEMFGAVVGDTISFGGGYRFHYDEDLADLESPLSKKVTRWVELTDASMRKDMSKMLSTGF